MLYFLNLRKYSKADGTRIHGPLLHMKEIRVENKYCSPALLKHLCHIHYCSFIITMQKYA